MKISVNKFRQLIREALGDLTDEQLANSPIIKRAIKNIVNMIQNAGASINVEDVEAGFEAKGSALGVVIANIVKTDPKVQSQKSIDALKHALTGLAKKLGSEFETFMDDMIVQIAKGESIKSNEEEGVFGKSAFAGPGLRKKRNVIEPNTEEEDKVYRDLKRHFNMNIPVPDDSAKTLKGVMMRGQYEDVITPPKGVYVFRGMKTDKEGLERLIGRPLKQNEIGRGKVYSSQLIRPWRRDTAAPSEGSNSWSEDSKVAAGYSGPTDESQQYSVVLVAKTSENMNRLMSGPNGLYQVHGFDTYSDEAEATSLGAVQLYKVYWKDTYQGGNVVYPDDRFMPVTTLDEK